MDDSFESDKSYWHRYSPLYADVLAELPACTSVLEYGVLRGDSVRWLRSEFPYAEIAGVDILPIQPSWPQDSRIQYWELDQSNRAALAATLAESGRVFDLVIEDGSHVPEHQRNCLVATLPYVRPGGVYVLEDLHTSAAQLRHGGLLGGAGSSASLTRRFWSHIASRPKPRPRINCLSLLLAIERQRVLGAPFGQTQLQQLTIDGFFTADEVSDVDSRVQSVEIYRRAVLPLACWSCRGSQFDYSTLTCACGVPLYADDDSMTAVIRTKES